MELFDALDVSQRVDDLLSDWAARHVAAVLDLDALDVNDVWRFVFRVQNRRRLREKY